MKTNLVLGALLLAGVAAAQPEPSHVITLNLKPTAETIAPTDDVRRDATVLAVERAIPSVVSIATETLVPVRDPFEEFFHEFWSPYHQQERLRSQYNLGSGVIIDEDGYLLTNDHVVRRADKIQIQLATTHEVYEAHVVASDPKNDIALLKIDAPPGTKFTAIKFAADDDVLLGETVLALGNPFGLGGSVSRGIVSAKSRDITIDSAGQPLKLTCLQTDAAINPGNSGGPLVNLHGELIGLNSSIRQNAQGIGFAIPSRKLTEALAAAFTPEAARQLWFGAQVKAGGGPLVVTSVQNGSPASIAGLKVGDTVLQVNGKTPRGFIGFSELMAGGAQTNVTLTVTRDSKERNVTVRLIPEQSFFNSDLVQRRLGIAVEEITPKLADSLGLPVSNGFIVTGIDPQSSTAKKLQVGAILTGIDNTRPDDLVAFAKLVHQKNPGETAQVNVIVWQRTRQGPFIQTTPVIVNVELSVR